MIKDLKKIWWFCELQVPFELEETIIWKFESLGISSFSIEFFPKKPNSQRLCIWLPESEWSEKENDNLTASLNPLSKTFGIELDLPKWKKIVDEDWSLTWKKFWQPDEVGGSILILPAWIDKPSNSENKKVIRIDPGSAFGTGSHPTTRLCLEALDREPPKGLKVADLGCGSGILGLASLAFGAKKVFSVDTDSFAIHCTKNNFLLNDWPKDSLIVARGSIEILKFELKKEPVDLLLCNILYPIIRQLAQDFDQILSISGSAFLSGILVDQVPELTSYLDSLGWTVNNYWEKSNWGLIEIVRRR